MSWPARGASGPVLAPAGHAAVDQLRVAREQRRPGRGRAAPSRRGGSLRSARRRVATSSSAACAPCGDFRSSVTERLPRSITSYQRSRLRPRSVPPGRSTQQHVGAHVGEQHAGERRRADRLELQHLDAGQRTHRFDNTLKCPRAIPSASSASPRRRPRRSISSARSGASSASPAIPCVRRARAREKPRVSAFLTAKNDKILALQARPGVRLLRPAGRHRARPGQGRAQRGDLQPALGGRDPVDDPGARRRWSARPSEG